MSEPQAATLNPTSPSPSPSSSPVPNVWRSIEELIDAPEFRERVEKTLPMHAEELVRTGGSVDRRQFLQLMGASLALAGLSGCVRRPPLKIIPYDKLPETVTPGMPAFYATSMPMPGGKAIGLLVESHEGRPTKVEGNPKCPNGLGAIDAHAQASILGLYDPERSRFVMRAPARGERGERPNQKTETWDAADQYWIDRFRTIKGSQGAGLRFLAPETHSPSLDLLRGHLAKEYPNSAWHVHDPISRGEVLKGWRDAVGEAVEPRYHFAKADVIVAIDSDFLGVEEDGVRHTRDFSAKRKVDDEGHGAMNRLYVVENHYTVTGGMADHRVRVPASQALDYLMLVAAKVLDEGELANAVKGFKPTPAFGSQPDNFAQNVQAIADDLKANAGKSLVAVGRRQPAIAHSIAAAVNAKLGNIGPNGPISLSKRAESAPSGPQRDGTLDELLTALDEGKVETLFILDGNPVFTAPADKEFARRLEKVKSKIVHIGVDRDETAVLADWHLPAAHYLESWGDVRGLDGTLYPIQPLIDPLFGGRTAVEIVAKWSGMAQTTGYDIARQAFRDAAKAPDAEFEDRWRTFLHNGLLAGSAAPATGQVDPAKVGAKIADAKPGPELSPTNLELTFREDPSIGDGRYANNGWLQEMPDPITKLTWDNAAYISPRTARELNVASEDLVTLSVGGRSLDVAALIAPGHADHSITLALGYGRTETGRTGQLGKGFNAYALRTSAAPDIIRGGVSIAATGRTYPLAATQEHFTMEEGVKDRIGELLQVSSIQDWRSHSKTDHAVPGGDPNHGESQDKRQPEHPVDPALDPKHYHPKPTNNDPGAGFRHQDPNSHHKFFDDIQWTNKDIWSGEHAWGMTIDLNTCTGCSACVVACQSENNIPVVGKDEVRRGREMHWIRADRYFTTMDEDDPEIGVQPVPCMHCENAPCEAVCPVNASAHSTEGLNLQAYNRCIGTRYCANNCPYKVRKFNWFNYNERNIGYSNLRWPQPYGPMTPRAMEEPLKMRNNPDVTVRIRGVMEKCTYCIQRIERAKIGAMNRAGQTGASAKVRDGEVTPACAQTCPANAIIFGDLKDPESRVSKAKKSSRDYLLVGDINTKPRTSYLKRIKNPNPKWVAKNGQAASAGGQGGAGHAHAAEPEGAKATGGKA